MNKKSKGREIAMKSCRQRNNEQSLITASNTYLLVSSKYYYKQVALEAGIVSRFLNDKRVYFVSFKKVRANIMCMSEILQNLHQK